MLDKMYQLSLRAKQRSLLYLNVRYKLDEMLIKYMLLDSLRNFQTEGVDYPFIDPASLKPGAKGYNMPEDEVTPHKTGLVLFYEDVMPDELKEHIELESTNRVTKERLLNDKLVDVEFASSFEHPMIYINHELFGKTLETLSATDYGLMLQLDPRSKAQDTYRLSHYRVMVEWSMVAAARGLAKDLGYISKDLYEDSEDKGLALKRKLFEYYGFHYTVGSRRRAAIRAAQLFKKADRLFTVYVGSSEARHLTKITEIGLERFALLKLPEKHITRAQELYKPFREHYLFDGDKCVFRVVYRTNENSQPGKSRKFDPKLQWLRIVQEAIMPLAECLDGAPFPYYVIYGRKAPFEKGAGI